MSAEAIRVPAAGAIFWAEAMPDGSAGVRAIAGPPPAMQVSLTTPLPSGLKAASGPRGLAILRAPLPYDHMPDEAELAGLPQVAAFTVAPFTVAGVAVARDGRFHPRQFSVAPTPAAPSYVRLYPSLAATRIGEAGAVVLNLQWQAGGAASWSVLQLSCTRNGAMLGFAAQADIRGDIIIPLTGLPPLPASQASDAMVLTARGDPAQSGRRAADPDAFKPVQLSIGGAFAAQQSLTITRGMISTQATLRLPGVTLQPA
jgi:hypothetical protein